MGVLGIAVTGIASVITTSITLVTLNREISVAMEAGRRFAEQMPASVPFENIFAAYNYDPSDDPVGCTCPGSVFSVQGLELGGGQGGLAVGEVFFPADPLDPTSLREDSADPELGLPRDLDGDGQVDGVDHSGDYRLLPVSIRMSWIGVTGPRVVEYRTLLTRR